MESPETGPGGHHGDYLSLHYTWKHRLIAALSRRANFTYTVRHGLASGMKRRGGLAFVPWGSAETLETRFLRQLDLSGVVVYDVGAFEGILTMFFSRRARHVVAFEPNPQSRERLLTNLRLNGISNVTVRDVGLCDANRETILVFDPLMPGAASGAGQVALQIREHSPNAVEVPARLSRLDDEIQAQGLLAPDFLKLDVEGMEAAVLRGAEQTIRKYQPALYIEMHGADGPDKLRIAREVSTLLWELGYRDILDIESATRIDPASTILPGHLYCQAPGHPRASNYAA